MFERFIRDFLQCDITIRGCMYALRADLMKPMKEKYTVVFGMSKSKEFQSPTLVNNVDL